MPTAPFLNPSRDELQASGRGARSGETYLTLPGVYLIATSTFTTTINTDVYHAIRVESPIVVDQLLMEVTAGAVGNARIGLYRADRSWQPIGAPLADSGNIDVSANGVKTYTPGTPVFLARGRYLTVFNTSVEHAVRIYRGDVLGMTAIDSTLGATALFADVEVGRTYAAFPTPGTAWSTQGASQGVPSAHIVFMRVSAP